MSWGAAGVEAACGASAGRAMLSRKMCWIWHPVDQLRQLRHVNGMDLTQS